MAKDPAVLWYWSNWQGGTSTFTRHLKGCYMDLLNAQFNNGKLSFAEIKTVLGTDFGLAWPTLQKKFEKDESGLFFNVKMEEEKIRRSDYKKFQSDSGKKGAKKRWGDGVANGNPNSDPNSESIACATTTITDNVFKDRVQGKDLGVVVYDAEAEILKNQIEFERICLAVGKNPAGAKESLRKYHLYLEEKEQYPKGRKAVFAGFEKWLRNEKNFNQGNSKPSATTENIREAKRKIENG